MKLQAAFLLSAFLATASHASAAVCTAEQAATIDAEDPNDTALMAACPVLFSNGSEVLHPTAASTVDAFKEIEPCKEISCTTYLAQVTDKTPDCELEGVNPKGLYGTVLKLCTKLAAGPISDADLEQIFEDLVKNAGNLLEAGSGSGEEEEVAGNGTITATEPTIVPGANNASNASTTAPAATKSGALSVFSGVVMLTATAVVSALVL